jgi:hypothetical protein
MVRLLVTKSRWLFDLIAIPISISIIPTNEKSCFFYEPINDNIFILPAENSADAVACAPLE